MTSFRVSIVAQAEDPSNQPTDPTIEATVQKLTPLTTVLRATNMEEVATRITEAWNDPARAGRKLALQLVGHGVSGLLHLGSSWMGEVVPARAFADPYFLIDTNPWSLGFLGEHRGRFDKIILAACRVGASDADGYAINGRTLAYTLCEHLQTTVIAAIDFTDPDEFDAQGEYLPVNHLLPCVWAWRSGAEPRYTDPNGNTPIVLRRRSGTASETFRIVAIRALVPARTREVTADIELRCTELDDERLLHARPELVVALAGVEAPAWLLGNGRVLRIGSRLLAVEAHEVSARAIAMRLSQPA